MLLRPVLVLLCALVLVPAALAAKPAPKPAAWSVPASLDCAKVVPPSVVNSLVSGTTFSFAALHSPKFKQGPTNCQYYDANAPSGDHNPYSGELVVTYEKAPTAAALASKWKLYSDPPKKSLGPFTPTALGDRAIEWNGYVVWTRGMYFGQVWSNGSSLGSTPTGTTPADLYAQLETIARYIDAKLPTK